MKRKQPLRVTVQDGVLRIEIGVEVLAHVYLHSDELWRRINSQHGCVLPSGILPQRMITINPVGFARDVKRALLAELGEDGSTLLSNMLDRACASADDDGSRYVKEKK